VRDDVTTEPPAHCRLVSGHDLFEIEAWSDCTASRSRTDDDERGECPVPRKIIRFGETESGIRFGADMQSRQRAGRAGQGRPQAAAKRLP